MSADHSALEQDLKLYRELIKTIEFVKKTAAARRPLYFDPALEYNLQMVIAKAEDVERQLGRSYKALLDRLTL